MSEGMAEAIRLELCKGSYQMPGDAWPYETQAARIAAALTEAGYGNVQEAKAEALSETAESPEALERARRRVEDELVEWRDSGLSVLGRNNGLTIRGRGGEDSAIIRFGFEDGFRLALIAEAELQAAMNDSEGRALVQAIHDRKAEG